MPQSIGRFIRSLYPMQRGIESDPELLREISTQRVQVLDFERAASRSIAIHSPAIPERKGD